tara:strand:- start:118 stop:348 length:231 start_codon:yes stop_codon:yes gene_type:complete
LLKNRLETVMLNKAENLFLAIMMILVASLTGYIALNTYGVDRTAFSALGACLVAALYLKRRAAVLRDEKFYRMSNV